MSWAWCNRRLYDMGPQFTYKEINKILNKYQRKYDRKWKRADYMACWRKTKHGVEMRHGWHCNGNYGVRRIGERLMLLFPDGRVNVSANLTMPYERTRFNHYFPFRDKWQMWWYRNGLILSRNKDWDNGYVIAPRGYPVGNHRRTHYIEFDKNGELITPVKGMMRYKEYKKQVIHEANQRAKPRRRGWYWTRRARNLYHDRSKCVSGTPWNERDQVNDWSRYQCHADIRQPPQTFSCGCRTYRKVYKRPFNKTVQNIFDEENATVRSAWIKIYGVQKFFEDAGAREIDKHDTYQLLQLETAGPDNTEADNGIIRAVKMVCPSTGTVYINAVPENLNTVRTALNWIYNVPDYFGTVGAQT